MSSRKRKYNRFAVGHFMGLKKLERMEHQKIIEETKKLKATTLKLDRIVQKAEEVDRTLQGVQNEVVQEQAVAKKAKFMSEKGLNMRQKKPTRYQNGPCDRAQRRRREETYMAAQEIHGGSEGDKTPAEIGLVETAFKKCSEGVITKELKRNKKVCKKILPAVYKSTLKPFEKSTQNMIRSVSVYYSGGVMGKKKYRSVYKDIGYCHEASSSKRITVNGCPIPNLVPYHKLMKFIKSIDIGTLFSVKETLCLDLPDDETYDGVYRDLRELLLTLATFYLSQQQSYDLTWFEGNTNTFYVSLGGDGAPFGKEDTAFAWLVSFLNIGRKVLSSNENYLLFGANCPENAVVVTRFIKKLMSDICDIEKTTFTVTLNNNESIDIKFIFTELPNDMKMLAYLAGELPNSAKYFSTFADVNTQNKKSLTGRFGTCKSSTWKPWLYSDRLNAVKKVEAFKNNLKKSKLAKSTKRTKVTTHISELKSRQEFVPLVGKLIDHAHIEPLHLKNNACAHVHKLLLNTVVLMSCLHKSVQFSQVPKSSPMAKYINAMKTQCQLKRLSKRVLKWFDEARVHGKVFEYRFTGKDSRRFLHNFMFLISAVIDDASGSNSFNLHVIAYICLSLRDSVSLFSRIDITDEEVGQLQSTCLRYYLCNVLYFDVNPTVWHTGHIVAPHTKEMKAKYGLGLGLNSMEGREAKHIFIAKYSVNTIQQQRWSQIFMHEYVTLIWLRSKGYNISRTKPPKGDVYIPKRTEDPEFCYCGLTKDPSQDKCSFCSHPNRMKIKASIAQLIS